MRIEGVFEGKQQQSGAVTTKKNGSIGVGGLGQQIKKSKKTTTTKKQGLGGCGRWEESRVEVEAKVPVGLFFLIEYDVIM